MQTGCQEVPELPVVTGGNRCSASAEHHSRKRPLLDVIDGTDSTTVLHPWSSPSVFSLKRFLLTPGAKDSLMELAVEIADPQAGRLGVLMHRAASISDSFKHTQRLSIT